MKILVLIKVGNEEISQINLKINELNSEIENNNKIQEENIILNQKKINEMNIEIDNFNKTNKENNKIIYNNSKNDALNYFLFIKIILSINYHIFIIFIPFLIENNQ